LPLWRKVATIDYSNVTSDDLDNAYTVLSAAITRAHPNFTREDLLELPISIFEIPVALDKIAAQLGILERAEGKDHPGEAQGETSSPTSMTSALT
jgi:hypothetical protein